MGTGNGGTIESLKGLGAKRLELLKKMGIDSIDALLAFYPRQYEDWSRSFTVSDAPLQTPCCVKATLATPVREHRVRKGLTLYKFNATDGKILLKITVFNNKYAVEGLNPGDECLFFGKVTGNFNYREMASPQIEKAQSASIRPIYRQVKGLTSRVIEKAVRQALEQKGDDLNDPLNEQIREEFKLCHKRYALQNIHFPASQEDIAIARKRLVFEELLVLQLGLLQLKGRNRETTAVQIKADYTADFVKTLPFALTGAQKRAIGEAVADMRGQTPMNRLLQGDVGSGKTAVAAALMFNMAKNGYQAAIMAPTEILAEQHYYSLQKMMKNTGLKVMLLTGSTPAAERRKVLQQLKSGEIDLIAGTHALIQKTVEFHDLGLVVTDEQHRFGVAQRSALCNKGKNPHVFVMSATPIPRTLALMIYGDLDLSVLDEMPAGRQKIETYAVGAALRKRAYTYVKKHLNAGRQGYIVCPMVEEGEMELAAAEKFYTHLKSGFFKENTVGLLHGKMKPAQKEQVMREFAAGNIQLLVATTVIEVGIDVPNAVIMVIENAERFGLSQLHQLRGRVGRGKYRSTCILISDAENEEAKQRLQIMRKTTDGFQIADADLKLRGPGDFFGHRQSGLPQLKIADLFDDMDVLRQTRTLASRILKADPHLSDPENSGLKILTDQLFGNDITF